MQCGVSSGPTTIKVIIRRDIRDNPRKKPGRWDQRALGNPIVGNPKVRDPMNSIKTTQVTDLASLGKSTNQVQAWFLDPR